MNFHHWFLQLGGLVGLPLVDGGHILGTRIGFWPAAAVISTVTLLGAYLRMCGAHSRGATAESAQPFLLWGDSLLARAFTIVSATWYATHIAGSFEPYVVAIPFFIRFALATAIALGVARIIASIGMLARFAAPFYFAILLALYAQNPALVAPSEMYWLTVLSAFALCGALLIGAVASFPHVAKGNTSWRRFLVPFFMLQMIGVSLGAVYQDKSLSELVVATSGFWTGAAILFAVFSIWMALYAALFSRGAHGTDRSA